MLIENRIVLPVTVISEFNPVTFRAFATYFIRVSDKFKSDWMEIEL